jgi:hypothetical protein
LEAWGIRQYDYWAYCCPSILAIDKRLYQNAAFVAASAGSSPDAASKIATAKPAQALEIANNIN